MKILQNIQIGIRLIYREILSSPKYVLVTFFLASIVFALSLWLPNFELIKDIIFSSNVSFFKKVLFLFNFLEIVNTNYSVFSASLLALISILFGLNISLILFYFKKRIIPQKAGGISILGMFTGLLGVGCASCSSFIISSLLGVGTAVAFAEFLPLRGQEFSILGVTILLYELYAITKKISDPFVCDVRL